MITEPMHENESPQQEQQRVEAIVAAGPGGAFALAGSAVAVVLAIWFAFYVLVFLARGGV